MYWVEAVHWEGATPVGSEVGVKTTRTVLSATKQKKLKSPEDILWLMITLAMFIASSPLLSQTVFSNWKIVS